MSPSVLAFRYAVFAALATALNIGVQHLSLAVIARSPLALPLAMGLGTGAGLVAKYLLDKRWIFADASSGLAIHARQFGLYSLMGVATTAVFWASELTFASLFDGTAMRDLGAALGLAVGYFAKYRLDRRFVFVERSAA